MNSTITDFIKNAAVEDIRQMYDLLRVRQEVMRNEKKYNFSVSDRVQFVNTKTGQTIVGHITKKNPAVAKVLTDDGFRWNVGYSLLSPAK